MDPLTNLGLTHQTDKVAHGFCAFYHTHLDKVRQDVRKVLEIGVFRGASLHMWRDYFPNATIHGFDVNAPAGPLLDRIHLHQGDQANRDSLQRLLHATGSDFDLIVDDGGHTMEQQQISLGVLFPHLRSGGLYALEDLHTSFMPAINYYSNAQLVHSVPTGIHECLSTSYALVAALARGQRLQCNYLSKSELDSLTAAVERVEIFDRDQDHNHITSLISKRIAGER